MTLKSIRLPSDAEVVVVFFVDVKVIIEVLDVGVPLLYVLVVVGTSVVEVTWVEIVENVRSEVVVVCGAPVVLIVSTGTIKKVAVETGVVEIGVDETGVVETGVVETGMVETGVIERGVVEVEVVETVMIETDVDTYGEAIVGSVGNVGRKGSVGRVGIVGKVGRGGSVGRVGKSGKVGSWGRVGRVGSVGKVGKRGKVGSVGRVGRVGRGGGVVIVFCFGFWKFAISKLAAGLLVLNAVETKIFLVVEVTNALLVRVAMAEILVVDDIGPDDVTVCWDLPDNIKYAIYFMIGVVSVYFM